MKVWLVVRDNACLQRKFLFKALATTTANQCINASEKFAPQSVSNKSVLPTPKEAGQTNSKKAF